MTIIDLKNEVGKARINLVINELLSAVSLYYNYKNKTNREDISELENDIYSLSARISTIQEQERRNTLEFDKVMTEKSRITSSLLKLLDFIYEFKDFSLFIDSKLASAVQKAEKEKANNQESSNFIKQYFEKNFNVIFQEFKYKNREELDGLIYLKLKNGKLGDKIYFKLSHAIKITTDKNLFKNHIRIKFPNDYLDKYKVIWKNIDHPVILLHIVKINNVFNCWWVNLKNKGSFAPDNNNHLIFPKQQKLGKHSFGDIKKLFGYRLIDEDLQLIALRRKDVNYFPISESIKDTARQFYRNWSHSPKEERTNPALGEITVNRVGWRHMTRKNRTNERVIQSWFLFGAAKKIIQEVNTFIPLGHNKYEHFSDNRIIYRDFVGLKGQVMFPHRQESQVMVVLKRQQVYDNKYGNELQDKKIWLYSIYESKRGNKK